MHDSRQKVYRQIQDTIYDQTVQFFDEYVRTAFLDTFHYQNLFSC